MDVYNVLTIDLFEFFSRYIKEKFLNLKNFFIKLIIKNIYLNGYIRRFHLNWKNELPWFFLILCKNDISVNKIIFQICAKIEN